MNAQGADTAEHGPSDGAIAERHVHPICFWTFEEVQDRLVEAMQFQRRIGGGTWPFASDGPWHLIVRDWWDWAAHEEKPVPRIPLSREQMARMEEATGWLVHAPEADRRLIILALNALAAGRRQVPWTRLLKPMRVRHGAHGLRKRYSRAITAICEALNAAEMRA